MSARSILVAVAVAAMAWAVARRRRVALNPQPEPPGAVGSGPSEFRLSVGGAERA